ncbi:MAG: S8 family serine peptidase [Planctomycetota bacterium]
MGENKSNTSRLNIAAMLLLLAVVVPIIAAAALTADAPSQEAQVAAPERPAERPLKTKETCVPGEIIVKLRDGQTQDVLLFSQPSAAGHEAVLARLQDAYGVDNEGPVFKGAHRRLTGAGSTRGGVSLASAAQRNGGAAAKSDLLGFYLLKTDEEVGAVCARLKNDPDVEYAQPNYIYHYCRTPNDPEFPDQYAHQLIQMSDAWDISVGSRDIVVAVLDTGVDAEHPDLKDNIWANPGEIPNNGVDDDNNGYIDDVSGWNFESNNSDIIPDESSSSVAGHGTAVSGVIAGVGDNGVGICGVNWNSSIMALRLGTDVPSSQVAEALDYAAANGARVANMSFGGTSFGPEGDTVVKAAIDNAFAQGVLLVASAGNDDAAIPNFPAAYYNVMAVASTNGEDQKTGHSSFGPWVDIAAPGTDIVTTDLGGEYVSTAGTSFSGPYVAAVGALVLSHRPELTHIEVRAILENTTDPVYYGDVDPDMGYVGTGRVNAYQALLASEQRHPFGEIVEPGQLQTFAQDITEIPVVILVHGDSYKLEYSGHGEDNWILLSEGAAPAAADGLVSLSFANPPVGVVELRLSVTAGGATHTDRKTFGFEFASSQAPWPMPQEFIYPPRETHYGSPMCLDVDGDGRNEIVQSSIKLTDYWPEGQINIWREDGAPMPGWPKTLGDGLFSPLIASGLAVGDIDGDGDYEIVVVDDWNVMATALHVESGETVEGDWPVQVGAWYAFIVGSPVLADLDGDGDSEIIVANDAESRDTDGLFAIQGDGTFLWQRRYTSEGAISAADFDGDGTAEIALCGYGPGITRVYTFILDNQGQQIKRWRGGSKKGTAVSDLDGDGEPELVFCTEDSVMAVHIDGSTLWTARIREPISDVGALSVGDIDDDGLGEVYVNSFVEADGFAFSLVYAFDHQGRELSAAGFPKTIMGYPWLCSPLMADIDGDGQKELLVASAGAPIMAWEADGSTTPGFPLLGLSTEVGSSPALEDLDQDGDLEMIVNGYDYRFHVIDLPAPYDPANIDWGMSRKDPQNSGWTLPAPTLDPILVPAQVSPGQRVELHLTTHNPSNLPVRLSVGNLPEGAYYDENAQMVVWKPAGDQAFHTYTFSFLVTDGIRQNSRSASVTVVPDALYWTNMDEDPSWQLDAGWAWGVPAGAGSWNGDPNSGYTGRNVIGYELDGDYADNMSRTRYATTGAIDCRGYENIRLSFRRWLGVESPYDYANIQVSNDGTTWMDLWTVGYSHISDDAWQFVEYMVRGSIAADQPTVYFRWGIGPTDDSVTCPGWNIDDVQVTGDRL